MMSPMSLGGSSMGGHSERWGPRRGRGVRHFQELEAECGRKGVALESSLTEARARIAAHNAGIVDHLKENGEEWKRRSDAAAKRRRELAVVTDDEYVQKE